MDTLKVKQLSAGFVLLHRKSIKNPLFQHPLVWHYFTYCILKASHQEFKTVFNGKEIIIGEGEFITGRRVAALETGLTEQNIRTAQRYLINLKMIEKSTSKSTSKYSVIKVCNYSFYNMEDFKNTSKLTSSQPASNQQVTTYNNNNNNNNKKKNIKKKKIVLPEWVPVEAWKDYLEHRSKFKPPMTDRAKELLIMRVAKLADKGHSPEKLLNKSIEKGWKDVYEGDDTLRDNFKKPTQLAY